MNGGWPPTTLGSRTVLLLLAMVATAPEDVWAQNPARRSRELVLSYAYPAGGQRGSTFRMVVGGPRMPQTPELIFSGEGIEGRLLSVIKPLSPEERETAQAELQELAHRKAAGESRKSKRQPSAPEPLWTRADEERLQALIGQLSQTQRAQEAPPFAARAEFEVRIAPDAPLGRRDLRLAGPGGISNTLSFEVDDLPEVSDPPLSALEVLSVTQPQRAAPWRRWTPSPSDLRPLVPPVVINGQIGPGQRRRHPIQLRGGQRLVFAVAARELRPYLADAVPGWFDAVITLYDPDQRPVATSDHWRFSPDPVLYYEVRRPGIYQLEIRDCIYRGREDFVYRIAVGEFPYVTDVFPGGGPAGAPAELEWRGWNLSFTRYRTTVQAEAGLYPLPCEDQRIRTHPTLRFAVDTLPELREQPDRGGGTQQDVAPPVILNGVVARPGEQDSYRFEGRKGQLLVVEVFARRLGSPLDACLILEAEGVREPLVVNDDNEDRANGRVTHHADARIEAVLPEDGRYRVRITDLQGRGGVAYGYRLRISEPRPDFELRVVPSAVSPRRGGSEPLTLHVIRKDGFEGEVNVRLKNPPPGFSLEEGRVPAGATSATAKLRVGREAPGGPTWLEFVAVADINGGRVERPVLPAEEQQQAFAWQFLVPMESFLVWVARNPVGRQMATKP